MSYKSWLAIPPRSHFSLANIPFGIISHAGQETPHVGVAIGEYALDLDKFAAGNGFSALSIFQPHQHVFQQPTLNAFAALGQAMHTAVRKYISSVFHEATPFPQLLRDNKDLQQKALIPLANIRTHLPMQIGDYTDFYVGMHHAYNCGVLFRGPTNALQPSYKHMPLAYHGRASSVVVSGTPIRRPHGQILVDPTATEKKPVFSPSQRLDFELELGAFVCRGSSLGEPVRLSDAHSHIFGFVLLNDWSARDIQAWEMVPLGPFNGKNFATTISPWVVLVGALEPFRVAGLENDTSALPYLDQRGVERHYDIDLEVKLETAGGSAASGTVTKVKGSQLLFSFEQMLAHHTVGGCNMRVGDLIGSGTISGEGRAAMGSLLEQSKAGKEPVRLGVDGEQRCFLQDGDTVVMSGCCGVDDDALVGFGESRGTVLPALDIKM